MKKQEKGGIALEYIIVTTFACLGTCLALGVLSSVAKKKIREVSEKFEVEDRSSEFDLLVD